MPLTAFQNTTSDLEVNGLIWEDLKKSPDVSLILGSQGRGGQGKNKSYIIQKHKTAEPHVREEKRIYNV